MKDKLAIIVPYRDRQEHLDVFVPHMREFLKDKGIDYEIFIAEQTDDRPFNYGKLCNVVVKEIGEEYTYFAFHDIDMLPISDECDYGYPDSPTHLATNVEAHENKLPYPQYFGGVVLISREDFENANGYSNEYWGYGFEDLDLLYRLQRSGAYLEKFYDLNNVYSNYDELDVLPYRIENVKLSSNNKIQKINYNTFDKETKIYGSLNPLTKKLVKDSFSISFWFKDDSERKDFKNLFSFEGCDTGLFLSKGNEIIGQIWDNKEKHCEVISSYARNRWNHCVLTFDNKNKNLKVYLNNKEKSIELNKSFEIYDYENHCIKISDETSEIKISEILVYNEVLNSESISLLYLNVNIVDDIKNKFGFTPSIKLNYNSIYKNNMLLDGGLNHNHLKIHGRLNSKNENIAPNEIYLPVRLDGQYNSLVHSEDTDIIKKYYGYDPDISENSDIFFHDIIPNSLDYKSIGLSTLKYSILDIQDKKDYELVRIVT